MARTYADAVRSVLARRTVKSAAKSKSAPKSVYDQIMEDVQFDKLVGHPATPTIPETGPALRSPGSSGGLTGEKLVQHGKALEDAKRREAVVKAVTDSLANIKNAPRRALSGVSTTVDDLKGIAGGAVDDLKGIAGGAVDDLKGVAGRLAAGARQLYNAARRTTVPPPARLKAPSVATNYDKLVAALKSPRNMAVAGGVALAGGLSAIAYRYISDYIARKREEEEKRRKAQTKQAFAPPPMAVPGMPRTVRYFGRLHESVLRAIGANARRRGRAGAIASLLATLATGGALAGSFAAAGKPPSAYDKLVAALKSTTAKRIGIGLGGAALGAGAVGAGIAAPKILDKLRTGGDANSPDGDARKKRETPEA